MTGNLPYRRVLISRLRFIGDVVLTTPGIESVRSALPDAFIAYLGDAAAVTLLEQNPFLNKIIPYHFDRPSVAEQARVALLLRRLRFDLAIDLFSNPRSALLMALSGARVRVGLDRRGRGKFFTVRVRDDGVRRTAVEFHNRFIEAAGIPPTSTRTRIVLTDNERAEADVMLHSAFGARRADGPVVGMHAGASWPAKKWPAGRFGLLARMLSDQLRANVVGTVGPGDAALVEEVRAASNDAVTVLPEMPVRRLAAVLSRLDAYVTNDAGPMHIAAAVGTPTIGLFGPGEEDIWFPYDPADGHRALRKDVPCHPCHLDFCNRTGAGFMECMELLTAEEVFDAVRASLAGHRHRA